MASSTVALKLQRAFGSSGLERMGLERGGLDVSKCIWLERARAECFAERSNKCEDSEAAPLAASCPNCPHCPNRPNAPRPSTKALNIYIYIYIYIYIHIFSFFGAHRFRYLLLFLLLSKSALAGFKIMGLIKGTIYFNLQAQHAKTNIGFEK